MIILFMFLIAGFILVLVELRKLRQLLTEESKVIKEEEKVLEEEKDDITRFEKDLQALEEKEGKEHNQASVDFVKKAISQNIPKKQIEQQLLARGWEKEVTDKIFESIK